MVDLGCKISKNSFQCRPTFRVLAIRNNVADDKVDDSERQDADNETNQTVKDGVFSFFNLAGIARRGHVVDAADNHHDDTDDAEHADDTVKNGSDRLVERSFAVINIFSRFADGKFGDEIFHDFSF